MAGGFNPRNARPGRGRYRPLAEINVTPLVDVMLVLLIVFMVTAPLLTSGVNVDLPKANAAPLNQDSEPLTVSINAEGNIFLQDQGVELDELVAPITALATYLRTVPDPAASIAHGAQVATLLARLAKLRDPQTGLYETFQDAQDEYIRKPFSISDNVLTWRALLDWADFATAPQAATLRAEAAHLRSAILHYGVHDGAPGAGGPILAAVVNASEADFNDVPPGSLMKLPALGFISEHDPLFERTYAWLHSPHYRYSHADQRYGLPGSYRLPFTTSWSVADHLLLDAGREQALKILRQSPWDGGIITEGVKPDTGLPDNQGRAFATAAGYVAHTICARYCIDQPHKVVP